MPTIQYSAGSAPLYLIGGSLGPPDSLTQTASRSLQPFLQGSLGDRPTDHATRSLTIGGIYVRSTVMWSNNNCSISRLLGLKLKDVKNFREIFAFFGKRTAYGKISKFCSGRFHRDTDQRFVQISWNLADGKSVKSCVAYLTKKQQNFALLPSCRYWAYRAQNWPEPRYVR